MLREILLRRLDDVVPYPLPGTDGFTVNEVLGEYLRLASRGLAPGPVELTRAHPELATAIERFFSRVARRSTRLRSQLTTEKGQTENGR